MRTCKLIVVVAWLFFNGCAITQEITSSDSGISLDESHMVVYYNALFNGNDYPLYGAVLIEKADSLSNPNQFSSLADLLCSWHQTGGYLLDGSSVTASLIPDSIKMKGVIEPNDIHLIELYANLWTKSFSFKEGTLKCNVGMVRGDFFDVSTASSLLKNSDTFYEPGIDCPTKYRFISNIQEVFTRAQTKAELNEGFFGNG